ncbi:MAG: orange carotenoid protein N-terminal domain-containing protein [Phormidesmis sp.]
MTINTEVKDSKTEGYEGKLSGIEEKFQPLSGDDKLAVLWYVYDALGETTIENPDDNKESDSSSDLFGQLKNKSKDDQLQFMRDVLSGESNDATSAYQNLSNTTKVALWYRLGQGMAEGSVVQVPSDYNLPDEAQSVVSSLSEIDFEQKYNFIRNVLLG